MQYIYDIETYPNCFLFAAIPVVPTNPKGRPWQYEISEFRNELDGLIEFLEFCRRAEVELIGFNNLGFDYPVIHFTYQQQEFLNVSMIYQKAMECINSSNRFAHVIWDDAQVIKQIDLYKIHHFDNPSKATSLKVLQFNMGSESVEDLPFPVGTTLTPEQIQVLREYNVHDCEETLKFWNLSQPQVQLRRSLTEKMGKNFMNFSDVKIGEQILITALEQQGVQCYEWLGARKSKRQTIREYVDLGDVIFPYVDLEHPEFIRIVQVLSEKIITRDELKDSERLNTKGVFKDLSCDINGVTYVFGTGGLHASIDNAIVYSNNTHQIVDVDVASYYPNMGIKNRLYPAHLGPEFCDAYNAVYETRKTFTKGSPENEAYKLALNGAYGGSNNEYSPFFDSQYTMSITINGQLMLCMLVEQLLKVPGLSIIQANTDGVTYLCPHQYLDHTLTVMRWWESLTKLTLEEALYDRMFIRDVNSYIALKKGGKIKRIGAYAYETALENPGTRELPWHKDWSMRVVAKGAEAYLVHGIDPRRFVNTHQNHADFLMKERASRGHRLEIDGVQQQNTIRFYIAKGGGKLEKVMPAAGPIGAFKRANGVNDYTYQQVTAEVGDAWDPRIHTKNKSVYEIRRQEMYVGYRVATCNELNEFDYWSIDTDFYVKEIEKLTGKLVPFNGPK